MEGKTIWIISGSVVAAIIIGVVIFFVAKKSKSTTEISSAPESESDDEPVGANEAEEKTIAATQGIDINAPNWRKTWKLRKKELKASGYSRKDIRIAKKTLKIDKTKKPSTGKGWGVLAQAAELAGQIASNKNTEEQTASADGSKWIA